MRIFHLLWLLLFTATAAWGSWLYRYGQINEHALLDRWTGELLLLPAKKGVPTRIVLDGSVPALAQNSTGPSCLFSR